MSLGVDPDVLRHGVSLLVEPHVLEKLHGARQVSTPSSMPGSQGLLDARRPEADDGVRLTFSVYDTYLLSAWVAGKGILLANRLVR